MNLIRERSIKNLKIQYPQIFEDYENNSQEMIRKSEILPSVVKCICKGITIKFGSDNINIEKKAFHFIFTLVEMYIEFIINQLGWKYIEFIIDQIVRKPEFTSSDESSCLLQPLLHLIPFLLNERVYCNNIDIFTDKHLNMLREVCMEHPECVKLSDDEKKELEARFVNHHVSELAEVDDMQCHEQMAIPMVSNNLTQFNQLQTTLVLDPPAALQCGNMTNNFIEEGLYQNNYPTHQYVSSNYPIAGNGCYFSMTAPTYPNMQGFQQQQPVIYNYNSEQMVYYDADPSHYVAPNSYYNFNNNGNVINQSLVGDFYYSTPANYSNIQELHLAMH
jgi:hypothetical protein